MNIVQMLGVLGGGNALRLQYLRPIADYAVGGDWAAFGDSPLYRCIDEATPDEDTTYCYSEDNYSFQYRYTFDTPIGHIDPDLQHLVRFRWRYGGIGGSPHARAILYGVSGNAIAFSPFSLYLETGYTNYDMVLNASQIADIETQGGYAGLTAGVELYNDSGATTSYRGYLTQSFFQIGEA